MKTTGCCAGGCASLSSGCISGRLPSQPVAVLSLDREQALASSRQASRCSCRFSFHAQTATNQRGLADAGISPQTHGHAGSTGGTEDGDQSNAGHRGGRFSSSRSPASSRCATEPPVQVIAPGAGWWLFIRVNLLRLRVRFRICRSGSSHSRPYQRGRVGALHVGEGTSRWWRRCGRDVRQSWPAST